jgi:hypothetical protein
LLLAARSFRSFSPPSTLSSTSLRANPFDGRRRE